VDLQGVRGAAPPPTGQASNEERRRAEACRHRERKGKEKGKYGKVDAMFQ
jgi:hypothetical protein